MMSSLFLVQNVRVTTTNDYGTVVNCVFYTSCGNSSPMNNNNTHLKQTCSLTFFFSCHKLAKHVSSPLTPTSTPHMHHKHNAHIPALHNRLCIPSRYPLPVLSLTCRRGQWEPCIPSISHQLTCHRGQWEPCIPSILQLTCHRGQWEPCIPSILQLTCHRGNLVSPPSSTN